MCAKSLQLYLTLSDPINHSSPGCSVHGILQARILEWVASSPQPRDQTHVSLSLCTLAGGFCATNATCEALSFAYNETFQDHKLWEYAGFKVRWLWQLLYPCSTAIIKMCSSLKTSGPQNNKCFVHILEGQLGITLVIWQRKFTYLGSAGYCLIRVGLNWSDWNIPL